MYLTFFNRGFDLTKFVQTAFTKLKSDVQLTTDLTIGALGIHFNFIACFDCVSFMYG